MGTKETPWEHDEYGNVRSRRVKVTLSDSQLRRLTALAKELGVPLAAFLRSCAIDRLREEAERERG